MLPIVVLHAHPEHELMHGLGPLMLPYRQQIAIDAAARRLRGGALYSPVRTSFRPQDSKFLTLQTGDVMTKATMCRVCGLIEITGDVTKLKRLTGESVPAPVQAT